MPGMAEFKVYLLAAGDGRRAGGPKAWQSFEGMTLLERQLGFLLQRFAARNIAVSIQDGWEERCRKLNPDVKWVPEDPAASPLAALQALLKASPLGEWGFVYHVDMPVWEDGLFERLAAELPVSPRRGAEAIVPVFKGRKGHPVLLSPELHQPLMALDPAKDRLDFFLRSREEAAVEVSFPCVLENWNSPVQLPRA